MVRPQIMLIHGGETFTARKDYLHFLRTREITIERRESWTGEYLTKALKGCDFIRPRMPLQERAHYSEWKIHFERHLPFLRERVILIGVSLGGIFLARYLSENKLAKRALAVHLVCPPFDNSLPEHTLTGGFRLGKDLTLLEKNTKTLSLHFSADDAVVPVLHAENYRKKLAKANILIYKDKNGHFAVQTFPELVRLIKKETGA